MGYEISKEDVQVLLKDEKLMKEVVKKVTEDNEVLDGLASDIAGELSSAMEDDPNMKKRIMKTALASPGFKQKIIKNLVEELGDD